MIVKPYYCPHCENFKWRFQTYKPYKGSDLRGCRHCDHVVYDTMDDFKDYLNDNKKDKAGEQK